MRDGSAATPFRRHRILWLRLGLGLGLAPSPCSDNTTAAWPSFPLRMEDRPMSGIHHVTAISGGAARNLDFYARVIGLRFVKKTVNFDDPGTYHLYYGDRVGHPGTILTFFPWEHAAPGRSGLGLAQQTTFRVPASAIGYWTHRFVENGVAHEAPEKRFGET